jgi:Ca2+-binding EF-hand superfamily protein
MNYKEFKYALRHLNFTVDKTSMKSLFALADRNKTGKLDEREFCEFWVFLNNHEDQQWGQGLFL